MNVQDCMSARKAGSYQLHPVQTSGKGGWGGKKDKSHRYSRKKKCIITLRASQW